MVDIRKCGFCSEPASMKCSNCLTVYYCNGNHQKSHWKQHKTVCLAVKQVHHPQYGRYLIATRNIAAGTLIRKEVPIIHGPPACSSLVCIGCYKPIVRIDFYKCTNCSWPACSKDCLTTINHEAECKILKMDSSQCGVPFEAIETPRYDLILIVRGLLLKKLCPKNWDTIQSLESHLEKRKSDPYHNAAVRYLLEVCKVPFDDNVIHHLRGAIITNSINTRSAFGTTVRGIYPTISMFNHSCLPNLTLRSGKNHTVYVHSTVNIKKGEALNFSYIPVTDPIWKRKEDLRNIYFFNCNCIRCTDMDEIGTHFSNMRCSSCREGYIRRTEEMHWKCSNCPRRILDEEVFMMSEDICRDLIANKCKLSTKEDLLTVMESSSTHHNHYTYLCLLQSLLHKKSIINPSVAKLDLRIYAWKEIFRILTTLEPGLTRRRGVSLVEMASMLIDASHEVPNSDINKTKLEKDAVIDEALRHVEEAIFILSLEPLDSSELKWLRMAKDIKRSLSTNK